jgi:hypothetical protein
MRLYDIDNCHFLSYDVDKRHLQGLCYKGMRVTLY